MGKFNEIIKLKHYDHPERIKGWELSQKDIGKVIW